MAKENGLRRGSRRRRAFRYPLVSSPSKVLKRVWPKRRHHKSSEKKEWDNATCPVCMEYPHNAVLLLCSSYNKGCRPYMCATSQRYSNCLEQYKKAYTKFSEIKCSEQQNGLFDNMAPSSHLAHLNSDQKMEVAELLCPLCRGQVKGWTVVEQARKYFNYKKRACMQDSCSFIGNFKGLRKHVKAEHRLAQPRAVDPSLEEKWNRLEHERERNDAISTIVSSMPGAVVFGDYVIEPPHRGYYRDFGLDDNLGDGFFPFESVDLGQNGLSHSRFHRYYNSLDEDDIGMGRTAATGFAAVPSHTLRRILLARSRMRRYREIRPGT